MKREITCQLQGSDVIQTTRILDDDGVLKSKNTVRLGDRDTVLAQLEEQVADAKIERDGTVSPKTAEPVPAADGQPGESVDFWVSGKTLYKVTTSRNAAGKVTSERTTPQGDWKTQMANAEERLKELTAVRDAVKAAK